MDCYAESAILINFSLGNPVSFGGNQENSNLCELSLDVNP
jgi:hypothetical protein